MMSQQDGEPPRPDLITGVTELEKIAQGGSGFHTSGFDLGVLGGRNNVDEEMRQRSGQSGSSSSQSQYSYTSSSGGRTPSTSFSTSSYKSQGNDNADDDYDEEEEYDVGDDDGNSNYEQSSHSSYSYSRHSNSNSDNPGFQHYRKIRDLSHSGGEKSLCDSAHCVNVRCVVGPLEKNTGALVALRFRPVVHTLQKVIQLILLKNFMI